MSKSFHHKGIGFSLHGVGIEKYRLLFSLNLYKETKSPIQIYNKEFVKNFAMS
jgi:hypothetical protein